MIVGERGGGSVLKRLIETKPGVVAANIAVALVYWAIGSIALLVPRGTGLASPIWPSAGLAFALLYQYGPKLLPAIAVGSFANNASRLLESHESTRVVVIVAGAIAIGAAMQAWLGKTLIHEMVGRHASLVGNRQILTFLSLSGPVACLVNATIGVAAQRAFNLVPFEETWRIWVTWWIGDTLGVIIFGPLTLMLMPEQREVWRDRRLKIAVPALLSVAVSVALFLQGATMSKDQQDASLQNTADIAASTLSHELSQDYEVLAGLRGLFVASPDVSQAQFRAFTQDPLASHPALRALSWDPVLSGEQLPAFTAHQRTVEGMTNFVVTERNDAGNLVPVKARSRYVVVAYIEPLATNAAALGFDIASNPLRFDAITRAMSTGRAAATAPIDLVQEPAHQSGFLMLLPVYQTATVPATAEARATDLRGFAVGVFRSGDLMQDAFLASRWRNESLALTDITDARNPVAMAQLPSVLSGTPLPTLSRTISAAGRVWRLDVTTTIQAGAQPQLVTEPAVMLVGLTIALVLMAFLLLISGMERQARREAEIDPLTGLYNRRALLSRLEFARRVSQSNGTSHVLLFLDLDRFKAVNDSAGHAAGDTLLQGLAGVLRHAVRDSDTVARLGGDEFAIILLDCNANRGWSIAEQVVQDVRAHSIEIAGRTMSVGVSVGLTMISPPDPDDVDDLLRHADRASYVAKFAGGNRVVQHKPEVPIKA